VRVACSEGRVDLEVSDEGRTTAAGAARASAGAEGGHGLLGMRERVALYGGSFEAVPRPGGGFRVRASLPYAGGPA
ncbi:MAG TPA: ATP-binding protein, partial [Ornithinibacter sp.]|nr:ATP-binding protein [Ornithinibacter sp.]